MALTMTPKERRQAKTRQAILDTARKIINSKGIDGLSIRSIAKAIDYSPAGLYEYFASKEEIVWAVCSQGQNRLYEAMAQVDPALPDVEYMIELGTAYLNFAAEYPDFFLLMFTTAPQSMRNQAPPGKEIDKEMMGQDSAFTILVEAMDRGVENGTFVLQHNQTIMELAINAWIQVHGTAMLWLTQLRYLDIPLEHIARQSQTTFVRGITR